MLKKIKIYHIRTLLLTYIVWTVLNLLISARLCEIAKVPLTRMPYYWGLLHIAPLMLFMPAEAYAFGIAPAIVLIIAAVFVAGLLIKERRAYLMIIIGMSLWFVGAFCLLGIGA